MWSAYIVKVGGNNMSDRKGVGVVLLLGWLMIAMLNGMVLIYGYSPGIGLVAIIVAMAMGIVEILDRWRE